MTAANRPNIVYIHSHDTGRYVQPYGYQIPTPNIQRMAEGGVLFRHAFCAAPTCSPSRAALLTGQSAHNAGMTGLVNRGFGMSDYEEHILHTLHAEGYHTVLAGLQHIHRESSGIGFDEIVAPDKSTLVDDVGPKAAGFITSLPAQPFFMDVGFFETHRSFPEMGPHENPNVLRPPAPVPDTPETRADMAAYCTMARKLDEGVGMVLDALAEAGLADNTLVLFTTDHGVAFPGCKGTLTDHGMGVAFILRGPKDLADGAFTGGRAVDAMISQIDFFPTVCELTGIRQPDWLQGKSFMPVLTGEVDEVNEEIFAEVSYHASYEPKRSVRTKRYKYIRRYVQEQTGHATMALANCDDSLSKDVWMEHGWRDRPIPNEQLYDLVFDPNEANNVADDPMYAVILEEMRGRLQAWMERTDDPILLGDGVVPMPPGSIVNKMDALSPSDTPGLFAVTV